MATAMMSFSSEKSLDNIRKSAHLLRKIAKSQQRVQDPDNPLFRTSSQSSADPSPGTILDQADKCEKGERELEGACKTLKEAAGLSVVRVCCNMIKSEQFHEQRQSPKDHFHAELAALKDRYQTWHRRRRPNK